MKPGERCTVIAPDYYGRTGTILFPVYFNLKAHPLVRFDGGGEDCFEDVEVIPESRDHDFDWLRERNLL